MDFYRTPWISTGFQAFPPDFHRFPLDSTGFYRIPSASLVHEGLQLRSQLLQVRQELVVLGTHELRGTFLTKREGELRGRNPKP